MGKSPAKGKTPLERALSNMKQRLDEAAVGFDVEIEPDGAKGPDLALTKDGVTARAEVRRIRDAGEKYMIDPTHRQIRPGLRVVSYWGDIDAGAKKILSCIKEKFRQVAGDRCI